MPLESEARLQRVGVLFSQRRYKLAEGELRSLLADDPENSHAHSLLSLCLASQASGDEGPDSPRRARALADATEEAHRAIGIEPTDPLGHYALAHAMHRRNREDEAARAVAESLRLEPDNVAAHGLSASIEFARKRFREALAAAQRGLAIDPEDAHCLNMRSLTLERLGRTDEAVHSAEETLRNDPDDPLAHAALGESLLARGKYREAQAAYREALRLDPDLIYARAGMVEAINSANPVYRGVYRFQNWASRFGQRAGLALFLGLWLLPQIIGAIGERVPAIAPLRLPITLAYIAFAVLTWISAPLFNSFLRFHPFGKHLLTTRQVWASNFIAPALALAVFTFCIGVARSQAIEGIIGGWYWVMATIPIAATSTAQTRGRMIALGIASAVVIALPWIGLIESLAAGNYRPIGERFMHFAYGSLGIQIVSVVLATRAVRS